MDVGRNRLLALLPPGSRRAFARLGELVSLPLGEALFDPGDTLRFVYFSLTATVALLHLPGTRPRGSCVRAAAASRCWTAPAWS